jgi:hypothetical protein
MAGKTEFDARRRESVCVHNLIFTSTVVSIRPHVCHSVRLNLCQIEGTRTEYTCRVPDLAVSECCSASYDTNLHKAVTQNVFSYTGKYQARFLSFSVKLPRIGECIKELNLLNIFQQNFHLGV